jgi:hypothetical protein
MVQPLVVKQEEGLEVPAEILARAITKLADGLEGWRKAGMKRHTLVILLVASTRVCKRDVELVLNGIDGLKTTYCFAQPPEPVQGKVKNKP